MRPLANSRTSNFMGAVNTHVPACEHGIATKTAIPVVIYLYMRRVLNAVSTQGPVAWKML